MTGILPAIWVVSCLWALSGILCFWSLVRLCRLHGRVRRRLFWIQLVTLLFVDLLQSIFTSGYTLFALFGPSSLPVCRGFTLSVLYLQFTSCLLEVHIAAGFAVASNGKARAVSALTFFIPVCFFCASGLLLAIMPRLNIFYNPVKKVCTKNGNSFFAVTMFVSCLVAMFFYIVGAAPTFWMPSLIRRRALFWGGAYLLSFLFTYMPRSVLDLAWPHEAAMQTLPHMITLDAMCLNGAVNVCVYMFCVRGASLSHQLPSRQYEGSGVASDMVEEVENRIIDSYFDLYLPEDAYEAEARRLTAVAIAEKRAVEQLSSRLTTDGSGVMSFMVNGDLP